MSTRSWRPDNVRDQAIMHLHEYIDRAYVINLPSRTDRRRAVTADLNRIGVSPGNKLEIFSAIRPSEPAGFPTIGTHGCYMSHLSVLRKAREEGLQKFLVCEDDLLIGKAFEASETPIVDQLQTLDWDFVFLGHGEAVEPNVGPRLVSVPHDRHMILLHMYLVNGRVLDRLIPFLELLLTRPAGDPRGGPMHVDGAISVFRERNPDVKAYRAEPILGLQRGSRSDIAETKWFDKVPVVRDAVGLARGLKTKLRGR